MDQLIPFLISLMLGLLIGLERGWHERKRAEGARVAGLRTFALIAMAGAFTAHLSQLISILIAPLAMLGLFSLLAIAYWLRSQRGHDAGITTLIAAFITFLIGMLPLYNEAELASIGAVTVAVILRFKAFLHSGVRSLNGEEMTGILQLAIISIVLLPILPDRPIDPWQVINPYEIWWMVVLIAGISLIGYFAIRIFGATRGLVITSLAGGLVSSTAVTISMARFSIRSPTLPDVCAGAILLACTIMFPRMLLEVMVVNPELLAALWLPLGGMTLIFLVSALLFLFRQTDTSPALAQPDFKQSPFQPLPALIFGGLLAAILLASHLAITYLGESAVVWVAMISALTDVDAPTLAMSRMAGDAITNETASVGIILAATVNSLVKIAYVGVLGSRALLYRLLVPGTLLLLWVAGYAAWVVYR